MVIYYYLHKDSEKYKRNSVNTKYGLYYPD